MSRACLIVSNAAQQFADEIMRASAMSIPIAACATVAEALESYAGQPVLFGDPDMLAAVLPEFEGVEWVQSTWAGVTPLLELDRRDYTLTGVKDVFGPQISEYVFGYLLAHELKVHERMRQQRMGNWFTKRSGVLQGRRIGIMGTGSIGTYLASIATHLGLNVVGLSRTGSPCAKFNHVYPVGQLYEFLGGLDYVISTLPDSVGTDRLLDAAALARLPAHAYLVNVGRGNAIDTLALIAALQRGDLSGAALDVFDEEPVPQNSPLWDTPNLTITAHIAAISHPSLIVPIFLENYRRYSENLSLDYVVDFDRGY